MTVSKAQAERKLIVQERQAGGPWEVGLGTQVAKQG